MGWADRYIAKLQNNEIVSFCPRGNSMTPLIMSGDLVTLIPKFSLEEGDIVLCKVKGRQFLHKIYKKSLKNGKYCYLIGNNKNFINGWTNQVYGKVIEIEHK